MPKKPPTPEPGNAIEGYLAPPEPVVVDALVPIDPAAARDDGDRANPPKG